MSLVHHREEDTVSFFVPGNPVPQGSKTGYVVGTRAVITDQNRATLKPWRATIANHSDIGRTFDCPVHVTLTFHMPKPKRPRWSSPAVKPDLDKLVRAAFDGMTDGGLLGDDARVIALNAAKQYAIDGRTGMEVEVSAA